MSEKLNKFAAERERARRKRDEWDARMKEWDQKFKELENTEICELVHAQNLSPEQLAELLKIAQTGAPDPAKIPDMIPDEMEDI